MSGKISQMIQEMKNAEESDGSAPECLKHVGRHNPISGLLRLHGLECLPHQGFLLQPIEPSGAKAPCSHGGPQRHVVVVHLNMVNLRPRALPIGPLFEDRLVLDDLAESYLPVPPEFRFDSLHDLPPHRWDPISKFLQELVRGHAEATQLHQGLYAGLKSSAQLLSLGPLCEMGHVAPFLDRIGRRHGLDVVRLAHN